MKTRIDFQPIGERCGKLALLGLLAASAAALSLLPASNAQAHGYVTGDAKSRSFLCSEKGGALNANCGGWEWDAHSVEYTPTPHPTVSLHHYPDEQRKCSSPFTQCGPADGWIASGGRYDGGYGAINEQNATRWYKNPITPGEHTFTWHYHVGHPVTYKEFYITRKDWNPNAPLTRDSFEQTPIARFGPGDKPADNSSTNYKVNIPGDRNGYQILLALEGGRYPGHVLSGDRSGYPKRRRPSA